MVRRRCKSLVAPFSLPFWLFLGVQDVSGVGERDRDISLPKNSLERNILTEQDFVTGIAGYFAQLSINPKGIHSVNDLIKFTEMDPREEFPTRTVEKWEDVLADMRSQPEDIQRDIDIVQRLAGSLGIEGVIEDLRLDALVMPTSISPGLPSILGSPIVTVPLGGCPDYADDGQPISGEAFGISFVGRRWTEESLIGMAYAFEQRTMVRKKIKPLFSVPRTEIIDVAKKKTPEEIEADERAKNERKKRLRRRRLQQTRERIKALQRIRALRRERSLQRKKNK